MSNGTTTWSYTYDANGMRTSKTNGSATYTYVYNGGKLVQMTRGVIVCYFIYDGDRPVSMKIGNTIYYYLTNLQGDVVAITNESGAVVASYQYDAWGNILYQSQLSESSIASLNPLRYRGYVYDNETELYYLQSRYYDPNLGRFINADTLVSTGQGILGNNMFAYCLNNPVCRKDIGGAVSQCIYDSEFDPTDDDNDLGHGYKGDSRSSNSPQHGQTTTPGNRGATSNAGSTQNSSTNLSSTNANSSSVPQNAYDVRDFVSSHNGSPPKGYKGGRTFANDGRNGSARLPERYAPYLEYDVRPKFVGQSRGLERIVIGNGVAYYTPDHYMSFILME